MVINSLIAFWVAVAAFSASCLSIWLSFRVAAYARDQSAVRIAASDLARIETELTELTDSYGALLKSQKKLRARIGMRNAREKTNGADPDEPDWRTDPGAFKRWARHKHLR